MRIFQMTTFFCLLLISACKNDPYPEGVDFAPVGEIERKIKKSQKASLFLQMQSVMQFVEGGEAVYEIKGVTPSGESFITVLDLPQGADFDPDTGQLRWNPDFTAGDSADINAIYREYPIKVQLSTLQDDLNFLERNAVLLVFNTPKDTLIDTEETQSLDEGEKYTQEITISSQDSSYYRGSLYSTGLPTGAVLEKSKKTNGVYNIRFTPKLNFVTRNNYDGYEKGEGQNKWYRDIRFFLHAVGDQGHITTKIIRWRVWDQNRVISIFAPKKVRARDSLHFNIFANDPNGEYRPSLSIINGPSFGQLRVVQENDNDGTSTAVYFHISWEDIPLSYMDGPPKELKFKACGSYTRPNACHSFSVLVHFEVAEAKGPVFSREHWPLGSIRQYELRSPPFEIPFSIYDPENINRAIKEVTIEVSSPHISVSWKSGKLLLSATEAGIYQFNVRAKTFHGVEGSESMIVEVINPVEETSSEEETPTNTDEGASDSEEGGTK